MAHGAKAHLRDERHHALEVRAPHALALVEVGEQQRQDDDEPGKVVYDSWGMGVRVGEDGFFCCFAPLETVAPRVPVSWAFATETQRKLVMINAARPNECFLLHVAGAIIGFLILFILRFYYTGKARRAG